MKNHDPLDHERLCREPDLNKSPYTGLFAHEQQELLEQKQRCLKYIEDNKDFDEIVSDRFDPALVRKIMTMVDRNEYKRVQAAPGLRITSRAFGLGRFYPIAHRFYPE